MEIFIELYHELINNKDYWFSKNKDIDIYLTNKYSLDILNIDLTEIKKFNIKEAFIGAIIAHDQLPFHYKRLNIISDNITYIEKASKISDYILYDRKDIYNYTQNDYCFIYLPYRHLKNVDKINDIIKIFVNLYINADINDKNFYKSYINATIKKIYKINNFNSLSLKDDNDLVINNWNYFSKILYNIPLQFNFLLNKDYDIVNKFKEELKFIKNENIIVSLSGGVDSNVCLFLIKYFNINNNNIVAVHINYNNRGEDNDKELEFLKYYCKLLDIKLYYRTINEIKREDCLNNGLRELYETSTRNIRYDMYKQISNLYNNNTVIMMGHNKDDCFENILTNINLKKNYNNLCGMERISIVDDIKFWRPLLNIDKKDIIDYANISNIPYFEDSTPKWSARGKIRDVVKPSLEVYDKNIISSFFELKDILKDNNDIIVKYVIPYILEKFTYNKNENRIYGSFEAKDLKLNYNIWLKIFISDIFYNFFINKISFKSLKEFIIMIDNFIENFSIKKINVIKKFVLNPYIYIKIYKNINNKLYIEFYYNK